MLNEMKTKTGTVLFIPTLDDVRSLKIGDEALDCFGRWSRVTEISYRGVSPVDGREYVGYYTATSETSSMSGSYREGTLVRTAALSRHLTSKMTDDVESYMRAKGERLSSVGG